MALNRYSEEQKIKAIELIKPWVKQYRPIIEKADGYWSDELPIVGYFLKRIHDAQYIEAFYFYFKTGDPVLDDKLYKSFIIKDYELGFGLVSGLAWGSLVALLPAWRGFPWQARLLAASFPFGWSMYRGFRRGYDQISYTAEPFMELHLRRRKMLEEMLEDEQYESEMRKVMSENGRFDILCKKYGLIELTEEEKTRAESLKGLFA